MNKGHDEITCAAAREQFAMLLYGELSFDEEERVESHLDGCSACRDALDQEKALHAAIDQVEIEPPPSLLRESREELRVRLIEEETVPPPARIGWWERFTNVLVLRPVAATALIAVGFLGARVMPVLNFGNRGGGFQAMGLAEPQTSRVRYVEPASGGRVQIVLDETRERIVSGPIDDQAIRALLLGAAKDPSDPGLRAETVEILNAQAQSTDVREVLIYALGHDQNPGVRLKAMEGLKPFVREPAVRGVFSQVLLSDVNPGLRTQAIDLLTGEPNVDLDRQIIGTLQELMQRGEPQDYVRERSRRALEAMKASAETY